MLLLTGLAQTPGRYFQAKSGAEVPLPAGFVEIPKESFVTTSEKTAEAVEGGFRRQVGDTTVSMIVLQIPLPSVRQALAELPSASGPLPMSIAQAVSGGMTKAAPSVRRNVVTTPLLYDNDRKAYGIEVSSSVPSVAEVMLMQPDKLTGLAGNQQTGAEPKLLRCLLRAISSAYAGGSEGRAAAEAARQCNVTQTFAASYIRNVTPAFFRPREVIERVLNVMTRKGATIIKFDTEVSGRKMLAAAWEETWTGLRVPEAVSVPRGLTSRLAFSNYRTAALVGDALGSLIGAMLFGLLFGLLFTKFKLQPVPAAVLGQAAVIAMALFVRSDALADGSLTGLGLVGLLASFVAFPVTLFELKRRSRKRSSAVQPS